MRPERRFERRMAGTASMLGSSRIQTNSADESLLRAKNGLDRGGHFRIKIGTIRHRSQWYVNGDPPVGAKIGDDVGEIDLDQTLEKYSNTRAFLGKILDTFLNE